MTKSTVEIHVLDKQVRLLQPADGAFRTSLDSVMLAAACPAQKGDHVLDLGCGVGGAPFCLTFRCPEIRLSGIEREQVYYDLAQQNAALNDVSDRTEFYCCDIRDFEVLQKPIYDQVMLNPPFREAGDHTPSPHELRAVAHGHQDDELSLEDWIKVAHELVKNGGGVTIIYPASGTDRIIRALGKRFGAVEIIPLWPRASVEAKRVIIRAIKDRKTPARIHAGLVLHKEDGSYTDEAEHVLRGASALVFM
ncbi:MAG TPA: methyltransferase [Alphaproteobacteria bacterium]|nr:methyltransferase [Alphaproteobacteria bacterium]